MTVILPKPRTCSKKVCTVSACFCCSPPVPWANDERNPAAHEITPNARRTTMLASAVAVLVRRCADHVAAHPIDFGSLASGPLGEALPRDEIELVAGDQAAVDELVAVLRSMADRLEEDR